MFMHKDEFLVVFFIVFFVVLSYFCFLLTRQKKRRRSLRKEGLKPANKERARKILRALKIRSKAAVSLPFGARCYVDDDGDGTFVCDLITLVGIGRYGGASEITCLGCLLSDNGGQDFLMRKPSPLETRFELADAWMVEDGWRVWSPGAERHFFDALAQEIRCFGDKAILRKQGEVLSIYFRGKHLNEDGVVALLPEWRRCCDTFRRLSAGKEAK